MRLNGIFLNEKDDRGTDNLVPITMLAVHFYFSRCTKVTSCIIQTC